MSLQDSLNKFKKQQEMCQSTLTSMAKAANVSKAPEPQKSAAAVASAASGKTKMPAPGPVAKFSSDTKRLQEINSMKKAPVGAQIKRVIDLLLKGRESLTAEEITEACYVEIMKNKAVFDSLRDNPKVNYDGTRFSFKPTHNLKNPTDLLSLIKHYPEGIAISDLKDSYETVVEDLQALKAEGHIWLLASLDSREDIAYPNDLLLKVDDDLKQLFRETELPSDMLDIERDLQKNGIRPVTNTTKRRAAAQNQGGSTKPKTKLKNKEITKRTKLTNIHLPELFNR